MEMSTAMTVVAPRSPAVQKINFITMIFTVYGLDEDLEVHFPRTLGAQIDEVICAMPGVCLRNTRDYTQREIHMVHGKTGDRSLAPSGTNQNARLTIIELTLPFEPPAQIPQTNQVRPSLQSRGHCKTPPAVH